MRLVAAVTLLLVLPTTYARAQSYDLAGLLIQSDAVVVAEPIAAVPDTPMTRYRVTQVLVGSAPAEIEINDRHYKLEDSRAEPRRVIFLRRYARGLALVDSGIRAVIAGELHRFAGATGMHATPQGLDPETHWRSDAPRIDFAQLVVAIDAAGRRVDAITRAGAIADPAERRAAMVAVFPPPGRGRAEPKYVDLLNERAVELLFHAGDLDGALAVAERDRTPEVRRSPLPTSKLHAYAADRARPANLRVTAIRGLLRPPDPLDLRAMAKLVEDPQPMIRRSAIDVLVRSIRISTSDAELAFIRDTLLARYAHEDDNDILFDIAETMYRHKLAKLVPHPRRAATRLTSYATIACLGTTFDAASLRAVAVRGGREVALPERPLHLQDCGVMHADATATLPAVPGVYTLVLTLSSRSGSSPVTLVLGNARMTEGGRVAFEP